MACQWQNNALQNNLLKIIEDTGLTWHGKAWQNNALQNNLLKIIEDTGLKPKASTVRGKFSEAQSCFLDLRVGWMLNIQIKPCTIELAKIY